MNNKGMAAAIEKNIQRIALLYYYFLGFKFSVLF